MSFYLENPFASTIKANLERLRDLNSTFDPVIIPKGKTRFKLLIKE
jgi:hypothetical protein